VERRKLGMGAEKMAREMEYEVFLLGRGEIVGLDPCKTEVAPARLLVQTADCRRQTHHWHQVSADIL
jgi:hypothetical protein